MKETRCMKIEIRVTADEKRRFEEAAKSSDMYLSEFIRYACERLIQQKEGK